LENKMYILLKIFYYRKNDLYFYIFKLIF
jgi:hypothetical protein